MVTPSPQGRCVDVKRAHLAPAFPLPCGRGLRLTPVTCVPRLSPRPGRPLVGAVSRQALEATLGPEPAGLGSMRPYLQMFGSMNILIFYLKLIWSSGSLRGF